LFVIWINFGQFFTCLLLGILLNIYNILHLIDNLIMTIKMNHHNLLKISFEIMFSLGYDFDMKAMCCVCYL